MQMQGGDGAAIEIPSTLLVWVAVMAFSTPPLFAAFEAVQHGRAEAVLRADAAEIARLTARAYEGASEDTRIPLRVEVPDVAVHLTVGAGETDLERSIVRYQLEDRSERRIATSPQVEIHGPECASLRLLGGVHDLRISFRRSGCGSANFVLIEPGLVS